VSRRNTEQVTHVMPTANDTDDYLCHNMQTDTDALSPATAYDMMKQNEALAVFCNTFDIFKYTIGRFVKLGLY